MKHAKTKPDATLLQRYHELLWSWPVRAARGEIKEPFLDPDTREYDALFWKLYRDRWSEEAPSLTEQDKHEWALALHAECDLELGDDYVRQRETRMHRFVQEQERNFGDGRFELRKDWMDSALTYFATQTRADLERGVDILETGRSMLIENLRRGCSIDQWRETYVEPREKLTKKLREALEAFRSWYSRSIRLSMEAGRPRTAVDIKTLILAQQLEQQLDKDQALNAGATGMRRKNKHRPATSVRVAVDRELRAAGFSSKEWRRQLLVATCLIQATELNIKK